MRAARLEASAPAKRDCNLVRRSGLSEDTPLRHPAAHDVLAERVFYSALME
ncbi:MAG TPA: hypothetical protein VHR44_12345 [Beijerinckiaceae bacterium]|nr:hypothetical protein [Beijerinckiaceae bacterium]